MNFCPSKFSVLVQRCLPICIINLHNFHKLYHALNFVFVVGSNLLDSKVEHSYIILYIFV